jgi:hypothetical protein
MLGPPSEKLRALAVRLGEVGWTSVRPALILRPALGFAHNGFREPGRASSRAIEIRSRTCKGVCGAGEMGVGRGEGESLGSLYACSAGR